MLPAIDVLRMNPDFEREIASIRERLHINWEENIKKIEKKCGKENLSRYLQDMGKIVWMKDLPLNNNFISLGKYLNTFKNKYYPKLSVVVNNIKSSVVTKIQPSWYKDIEKYILFNICSFTPFVFSRPTPEVTIRHDKITNERYIQIKVFSDTDTDCFKQKYWRKMFQGVFPNHLNIEKIDDENNLRRFLHFVLREKGGFNHKDIYEWLQTKGIVFSDGDYSHASQELSRYKKILGMKK